MANEGNSEHMKFCKKRAREALNTPGLPLEERIIAARGSLLSDFGKDPSTVSLLELCFLLGLTIKTERDCIDYIDGFNG